ncbi:MAG: S1C family serine protease [Ignavibacteria bacterium]
MARKNRLFLIIFILVAAGISVLFLLRKERKDKLFHESNESSFYFAQNQEKDPANNEISNTRKNIITETVRKISPAVVGINVIEIREYRDPYSSFFDDPFFRRFFGNRGTYKQKVKGLGSGFIISSDGYIVTNDHVAGNGSEITVTMTNGNHYNAKIVGSDPTTDICLLKIDGTNLPYMYLGNSDDIMIGEWVVALGNPFGLFEVNNKPTVTVGVVSSTGMNLNQIDDRYYLNMIQTDAAINGGNSGGPLVNSIGEVIGMNTLIFTAGGNEGSIGLGFAISINKVKKIVGELKEKGRINRDFEVGLRIQNIDEGIARAYQLTVTKGVIVTQIISGTPASKSGIKPGDIITEVEGFPINSEETLIGVFQEFRTGQTISIKILRDGDEQTKKMTLEKSS